MNITACIFDLDGVLVSTSEYHYLAWKKLSNSLGFDLTREQNEEMKGISRMDSLDCVLKWGGVTAKRTEKIKYAAAKNTWYLEFLEELSAENLLPNVVPFLNDLKAHNIQLGLGSASKNAKPVLNKLNISHYFEVIVDGNDVLRSKPDPEVFIKGAKVMKVNPKQTVVFEDSAKGIDAAISGNFQTIGIGEKSNLGHADFVIPDFSNFNVEKLIALFSISKMDNLQK